MVELPVPAVIDGGAAVTVDRPAFGAPAVPVAVKVTGLPLIPEPAAVAVSALGPAVGESVQLLAVAIPPAPVVCSVLVPTPLQLGRPSCREGPPCSGV